VAAGPERNVEYFLSTNANVIFDCDPPFGRILSPSRSIRTYTRIIENSKIHRSKAHKSSAAWGGRKSMTQPTMRPSCSRDILCSTYSILFQRFLAPTLLFAAQRFVGTMRPSCSRVHAHPALELYMYAQRYRYSPFG
jgi:hypothetical protein